MKKTNIPMISHNLKPKTLFVLQFVLVFNGSCIHFDRAPWNDTTSM